MAITEVVGRIGRAFGLGLILVVIEMPLKKVLMQSGGGHHQRRRNNCHRIVMCGSQAVCGVETRVAVLEAALQFQVDR